MKNNFNPCLLPMVCLALTISACEQYLDQVPDKSIQTPKTISDFQALLDYEPPINLYTPDIGLISSDDVYLNDARFNARPEYERSFYTWRHDATLETVPNSWSRTYQAIFIANTVIDGLKKIQVTETNKMDWETCLGIALFHRGKNFLQAATLWAEAYKKDFPSAGEGIPLKYTPDIYEITRRASIDETYGQILNDLESAAKLLPDAVPAKTRPSKAAAYGYLARTHLAMSDYSAAGKYADSCLLLQSAMLDYNMVPLEGHPFQQFNEEVIIHFVCEKPLATSYLVNPELYERYDDNDLRKLLFFNHLPDGSVQFVGNYNSERVATPFTGLTTAEMWLTHAECLALAGERVQALDKLNHVLRLRYHSPSFEDFFSDDINQVLARIREERRKELVFRDTRWFDMKRLNRDGENIFFSRTSNGIVYELPANSNKYALPIPDQIIRASGIKQNPD